MVMNPRQDEDTAQEHPKRDEPITNLTIRDFFATAALIGEMASMTQKEKDALKECAKEGLDISAMAAENSYLYADSMLEARTKTTPEIISRTSFPTQKETDFWGAIKALGIINSFKNK